MKVIGITGKVASGKTTLASLFNRLGFPVFDADKCVHNLYATNLQVIEQIASIYPDSYKESKIDRNELKKKFY